MSSSMLPAALVEMLLRFYGWGAERDYSNVSDSLMRRPFAPVADKLRAFGPVRDLTDPNDEVSFGYSVGGFVVRLSMIGPYATVLQETASNCWTPISEAAEPIASQILAVVRAEGFEICGSAMLERSTTIWDDRPSLYEVLFVNDEFLPWR